jgi:hypothetical protein
VPLLLVQPDALAHLGIECLRRREIEGGLARAHCKSFGKARLSGPCTA